MHDELDPFGNTFRDRSGRLRLQLPSTNQAKLLHIAMVRHPEKTGRDGWYGSPVRPLTDQDAIRGA
jgi:hypothetical protein